MYLRKTRVKGHEYWQLAERVRHAKGWATKVRLHLGTDINNPEALMKWWKFLGKPLVEITEGASPDGRQQTIKDLEKFLARERTTPEIEALKAVLVQLGYGEPDTPPGEVAIPGRGDTTPVPTPERPHPPAGAPQQMSFTIPLGQVAPTHPLQVKAYAYTLYNQGDTNGKRYPLTCWRIQGRNGAWWPTTENPENFLSFEEAQKKLRQLWKRGGKA